MDKMEIQVTKEHYDFSKYSHEDRWVSYYYQLKEVLEMKPKKVLEIGVGDQVFGNYLKSNTTTSYTSLDIDPDLKPDVVGDVLELPFKEGEFDVICAFEVLEHLPYEKFSTVLGEFHRVSNKYVALSLPHFGPPLQFSLKLPKINIKKSFKLTFEKPHVWNGQHYWEIGKKGYSVKKISRAIKDAGFVIKKDFVPHNSQYHHFFILEKNNSK